MQLIPGPSGYDEHDPADLVAIRSAKRLLRKSVRLRRDLRSADERRADDTARFEVLTRQLHRRALSSVAAYLSSGSEPGTLQIVAWLAAQEVRVLLPVLTDSMAGGRLPEPAWAPYNGPDKLRSGPLSILEPTTAVLPAAELGHAQLVICAGLAANIAGQRLGRGGGWYDRALSHARPHADAWVLLNDDEVLDTIPTEGWDRPVDAIVTQGGFIGCERSPDPVKT